MFQPQETPRPMNWAERNALLLQIIQFVIHAWACNIYPFVRTRFGARYFGFWECFAPVAMLFFMNGLYPSATEVQIFQYMFWAWLIAVFIGRMSARREYKGGLIHSRYDGHPRVCDWLNVSEKTAKVLVEPMLVFGVGVLVFMAFPRVGAFICTSAVMCVLDYGCMHEQMMRRVRDMRDSEIEQGVLNQMYENYSRKGR